MYILMRALGMRKKAASRLYWDVWVPVEITVAVVALIRAGFIH